MTETTRTVSPSAPHCGCTAVGGTLEPRTTTTDSNHEIGTRAPSGSP